MTFLARIALFLFWLLVVSWSVALLRRGVAWMLRSAAQRNAGKSAEQASQAGTSRRLHRDAVCGMHVSEEISFPVREGEATLHFCSTECRDKYTGAQRKAASA
jgi:YHS domain-containing protein